jgi:tetratricopeptide (TPR) repeat protein
MATLAAFAAGRGDLEASCEETRRAAEAFLRLVERNPGMADYLANWSQVEGSLARRLARLGRADEALEVAERAQEAQKRACAMVGDHPVHRALLAGRCMDLALVNIALDDLDVGRSWIAAARETGAFDLDELSRDADVLALSADPRFDALIAP